MGRRLKRGKLGNAAQYITRTQAVRKLQLRLSEFRRLCILKGVHPREPKKKVHGANKTYYHTKDIVWLQHEPLLNAFRNLKAWDKKVRKAHAKLNHQLARRLADNKPTYKLDHLVKERYPSFVDALRDLDDPLTMVHLFAALPAEKRFRIPTEAVGTARRLALEFQAYVVRAHALRKVFISVKGFYYQAEVMGQSITWLVPHQLAQVLPVDVDYRVMLTFLDFYECLLQFTNFKLYHTLGLKYPPVLDSALEEAATGLAAIMKDLAGLRDDTDSLATAAHAAATAGTGKRAKAAAAKAAAAAAAAAADAPPASAAPLGGSGVATADEGSAAAAAGRASKPSVPGKASARPAEAGEEASDDDDDAEGLEIDSGDGDDDEVDSEAGEDDGSDDLDDDDQDASVSGEDSDASEQSADAAARKVAAGGKAAAAAAGEDEDATAGGHGTDDMEEDEGEAAAGGTLELGVGGVDDEAAVCGALFRGRVFFLSREVPREPLLFVIRAFGGVAGWDGEGSPIKEADEGITHQVVDRPRQSHRFLSRAYVQPQWVVDSANFRCLLPADLYTPGQAPPPHLSPFVNNDEEGYTPEFAQRVKKLQDAARAARQRSAGVLHAGTFVGEDAAATAATAGGTSGTSHQRLLEAAAVEAAAAAEKTYAAELARELRAATKPHDDATAAAGALSDDEDDEGRSGDEDGSGDDADDVAGAPSTSGTGRAAADVVAGGSKGGSKGRMAAAAAAGAAEENAMKDIMMTRKNRKLYERIQRAKEGKSDRVGVLERKRAALVEQQPEGGQPKRKQAKH